MSSDIVLTAALRTNLLSLQNTQNLIDKTQLRLATGLKVNSALDNPQSFFASEGLKNRASDLARLLDGIGQSIQTLQAADTGIKSLTKLIDQAESLADAARTALGSGSQTAQITGNVAFDGSDELIDVSTSIAATDELVFTFTDENGDVVALDANTASSALDGNAGEIAIAANQTVDEFLSLVNGLRDTSGEKVIKASLTSEGYIKFEALTGGSFEIEFETSGSDSTTTALAEAFGFGGSLGIGVLSNATGQAGSGDGAADANAEPINRTAITASRTGANLQSFALYQSDGTISKRSDTLAGSLKSDLATEVLGDFDTANNGNEALADTDIIVRVNNGNYINITTAGSAESATIQDLIDGINDNTSLNEQIVASYDEATGKISISALTADVKSFSIGLASDEDSANVDAFLNLGFGLESSDGNILAQDTANNNTQQITTDTIAFGPGAGQLAQIESDFNTLRAQIDELVEDSSYRGINLLAGDTLTTFFNEDSSNSLVIEGQRLDTGADGLAISAASFTSLTQVETALTEVRSAKAEVRNFSSSLATSLNILQTRQDFTSNLINTLQTGSDKLVVADQNEEGANLLALQTRQALGTTSLSLASQSQQSVLRLF